MRLVAHVELPVGFDSLPVHQQLRIYMRELSRTTSRPLAKQLASVLGEAADELALFHNYKLGKVPGGER